MTPNLDPVAHNRDAWDRLVSEGNEWTQPVTPEVIARARNGDWSVVLIGHEPVPRDWFPADLCGVGILGLAAGGGQQGPVLAAAGANVTVLDNSTAQIAQDKFVADRDGLTVGGVVGDMRDLSQFADGSFDMVFHPVSNLFCPDVRGVWRECFRVLRPGGLLLAGFLNPHIFIFDQDAEDNRGELIVRHSLPYSDLTSITPEEREKLGADQPIVYSHTMAEQVAASSRRGLRSPTSRSCRTTHRSRPGICPATSPRAPSNRAVSRRLVASSRCLVRRGGFSEYALSHRARHTRSGKADERLHARLLRDD